MKFVPYNPDFDPSVPDPFEAEIAGIFGHSKMLDGAASRSRDTLGRDECKHLVLLNCTKQEIFNSVNFSRSQSIVFSRSNMKTINWLNEARDLHSLVLRDLPKVVSLDPLASCRSLQSLIIEDCSRIVDIAPIAKLSNLRLLRLSGRALNGARKTIDLTPIGQLKSLRHLSIRDLKTSDESLASLAELPRLETLQIEGSWPARELARMAVLQPHLVGKTTFLKPLVASAYLGTVSFHDVDPVGYPPEKIQYMVSGKGGADGLRPGRDDSKINLVTARWKAWIEEFSEQYGTDVDE